MLKRNVSALCFCLWRVSLWGGGGEGSHHFLLELRALFGRLERGGEHQSEVLSVMRSGIHLWPCTSARNLFDPLSLPRPLPFSQQSAHFGPPAHPRSGSPPLASSLFGKAPLCLSRDTFQAGTTGTTPSPRLCQGLLLGGCIPGITGRTHLPTLPEPWVLRLGSHHTSYLSTLF